MDKVQHINLKVIKLLLLKVEEGMKKNKQQAVMTMKDGRRHYKETAKPTKVWLQSQDNWFGGGGRKKGRKLTCLTGRLS